MEVLLPSSGTGWLTTPLEPFPWQPVAQGMKGKTLNEFPDGLVLYYFNESPLITFASQKFRK